MKQRHNNSPRLQNAINQVVAYFHNTNGGWWPSRPYAFGIAVFNIAYKADKYDVLNKTADGHKRTLRSFIRGDIRRKRSARLRQIEMLILIFIILFIF